MPATKAQAWLNDRYDEHVEQLKEFLRIPSISALSEHAGEVQRAAEFLAAEMRRIGLQQVKIMPTGGHPVVYGEWLAGPDLPTALVYGHYDVQPVDPEHLWETPPFEPTVRHGRLYARGASDDKGQVFLHLKAVEALLQTDGRLPLNVKFLIEGEEEVGSRNLDAFVQQHRDKLAADVCVISDTPFHARGVPSICYGLRGLTALEVTVRGAQSDLHSGLYGGAVPNPLHELARLIASLHDADGRVTVPGFYDRVRPLTPEERQAFRELPFDEEAYRAELGVPGLHGEAGYTTLERTSARPTLELNGMWGGFQGEGTKTVLPCEAHAKITCRLVPDQDPDEIAELIVRHLQAQCPPYVTLSVKIEDGSGKPAMTPLDHPAMQAAARALAQAYGQEPRFTRMGGSIPVVQTLMDALDLPVVLLGFGLPDENYHAPNEHFDLTNFRLGMQTMAAYWHELAAGLGAAPGRR